jgi:hypothetical protein
MLLQLEKTTQVLDNNLYTIAEVYNYNISSGKYFDFGQESKLHGSVLTRSILNSKYGCKI